MSYQVLARKYRPASFEELVGQEYVLRALTNALEGGRLHHAYLFTGTRGVGKTTVARVFARCLNCETGITASPCGGCSSCVEIVEGRSADLIEVDAASRTGVDDTLELLENVQYMPAHARFKVYLIDEVHMFSRSSFNALLKTLEEPPEHVKFLLVTTDPRKLPITVLSRCLQFNLKNMTPERVVEHLQRVLEEEQVEREEAALWLLGRAADGSMRDALSLTDQAIAFGNGKLLEADVRNMLGTLDTSRVFALLEALLAGKGADLLQEIDSLADYSVDFAAMLDEVLSVLHRLAVLQAVPDSLAKGEGDAERLAEMAGRISGEDLQLFYQIGLIGRRDLPLAPSPRSGFEMVMLRMLTFTPDANSPPRPASEPARPPAGRPESPAPAGRPELTAPTPSASPGKSPAERLLESLEAAEQETDRHRTPRASLSPAGAAAAGSALAVQPVTAAAPGPPPVELQAVAGPPPQQTQVRAVPEPATAEQQAANDRWLDCFPQLDLVGATRQLADNCALLGIADDRWHFALAPEYAGLHEPEREDELAAALGRLLDAPVGVGVELRATALETPALRRQQATENARRKALAAIREDPNIGRLLREFDASLDEASITPRNAPD